MGRLFWEAYPAYIQMGMPADEYWNGDAEACVAYRKAFKERLKLQDIFDWRLGLYFYHALCCVAPSLNALHPQSPTEYIKPFGFEKTEKPVTQEEIKKADNPGKAYVQAWADRVNKGRKNGGRR